MSKFTISGFYDEVSTDLSAQIAEIKKLGESYLCPRSVDGKNIADYTAEEFAKYVKPILDKNEIKFSSIGSPIGKIDIDDEAGFESQKKKLVELVKIAQMMDCKYIRAFSFYYGDRDPDSIFDKVLEKTKQFVEIVKGSGVKFMHENEKLIYGDVPERVLKLYNAINDEDFVLCFDASNYVQCDVNPQEAFDMLKDLTVYYHIKDCSEFKVEVPVGTGKGCYDYIFAQLKERNYEGFVTMEPHIWKYAVMKIPVYFIPFMPLIMSNYFKAFRLIDKAMKVSACKKISRKQVFEWQYENLKKLIEG